MKCINIYSDYLKIFHGVGGLRCGIVGKSSCLWCWHPIWAFIHVPLLHFQFSSLSVARERHQEMVQVFGSMTPKWKAQRKKLLSLAWLSSDRGSHLENRPIGSRSHSLCLFFLLSLFQINSKSLPFSAWVQVTLGSADVK